MPSLGLGTKTTNSGLITPGIVTDNLVLKHNYNAGSVIPVSDGAAHFDNNNDYISISSQTLSNTTPYSITFWVMRDTLNDWENILVTHGTTGNSLVQFANNATAIYIEGDADDRAYSTNATMVANKWQHYAITADGSNNISMYLDGVLLTLNGTHNTVESNVVINAIGSASTTTTSFGGHMCNLGIWSGTQLSQAQIKSIMNKNYAGLTSSEKTNLVSWWNLDTAYDSIVFDNHHNGGETLGSELLTSWTNNDFTSFSSNGTDITSAVSDGSANHEIYSNQIDITAGDTFKVTFTIGGNAGSGLDFRLSPHSHLGSADYDTSALSAGTYTYYIKSGITDSTSFFGFRSASQTCDFSISNFSVKKINGNAGKLT